MPDTNPARAVLEEAKEAGRLREALHAAACDLAIACGPKSATRELLRLVDEIEAVVPV